MGSSASSSLLSDWTPSPASCSELLLPLWFVKTAHQHSCSEPGLHASEPEARYQYLSLKYYNFRPENVCFSFRPSVSYT